MHVGTGIGERASGKRRRALQECNSPSNTRGARLQTAAAAGGMQVPLLASKKQEYAGGEGPMAQKLPEGTERSDGPEETGGRRPTVGAREGNRLRACPQSPV